MFTLMRGKNNHLKNSRILFKSYKIKSFTFNNSRNYSSYFRLLSFATWGILIIKEEKMSVKEKIEKAFKKNTMLAEPLHQKALQLYRDYLENFAIN